MAARSIYYRLVPAYGRQCNSVIPSYNSLHTQSEIFCPRYTNRDSDLLIMTFAKPSLGRAWRRTFWHVYDNLGLLILTNTLWLIFAFTIILKPAASMALFHVAYLIIKDRPVKISDFFAAFKRYFLKISFLIFILCIIWLFLLFNIKFYLQHFGLIGLILSGITFWLLLFSLLGLVYIYPLLCRGHGIWRTVRYSYVLTIDNLRITLFLFFYLLILVFLEILIPILGVAVLTVFMQNAFLEIERRYNPSIEIPEPMRRVGELLRPWKFS